MYRCGLGIRISSSSPWMFMFRYLVIQVAQLANSCSGVLFICLEAVLLAVDHWPQSGLLVQLALKIRFSLIYQLLLPLATRT